MTFTELCHAKIDAGHGLTDEEKRKQEDAAESKDQLYLMYRRWKEEWRVQKDCRGRMKCSDCGKIDMVFSDALDEHYCQRCNVSWWAPT